MGKLKKKKKTFVKGSYVFYTFNYRKLCDMQNFKYVFYTFNDRKLM